MISPIIEMVDRAKVRLTYPHLPEFELNMDFNPIIEKFKLAGNFCLMHWQAKPKNLRRWGIYDANINQYFSLEHKQIQCSSIPDFLQINEERTQTVPTAVVLFRNAKVLEGKYVAIISH